eukprot:TRINITY_DN5903_c0_g1_i1.p1 TRINITY_DN5903_c0_g1~~TRINITY_DN5903_c0_g1_i1.p1  ORF type:complete len:139 (+),score=58.39 TRINITY_DN5903_c0_g1_i1:268-684(+)
MVSIRNIINNNNNNNKNKLNTSVQLFDLPHLYEVYDKIMKVNDELLNIELSKDKLFKTQKLELRSSEHQNFHEGDDDDDDELKSINANEDCKRDDNIDIDVHHDDEDNEDIDDNDDNDENDDNNDNDNKNPNVDNKDN